MSQDCDKEYAQNIAQTLKGVGLNANAVYCPLTKTFYVAITGDPGVYLFYRDEHDFWEGMWTSATATETLPPIAHAGFAGDEELVAAHILKSLSDYLLWTLH